MSRYKNRKVRGKLRRLDNKDRHWRKMRNIARNRRLRLWEKKTIKGKAA